MIFFFSFIMVIDIYYDCVCIWNNIPLFKENTMCKILIKISNLNIEFDLKSINIYKRIIM